MAIEEKTLVTTYKGRLWKIEECVPSITRPKMFMYTMRRYSKNGNPGNVVIRLLGEKYYAIKNNKDQDDRQQTPKDASHTL